jgi:hypothetical protein
MSINTILPFCALPSVSTARIQQALDDYWFTPSPPPQFHTQDLQISNRNIGSSALVNLLCCFPSLRKLYYEKGGVPIGREENLPQDSSISSLLRWRYSTSRNANRISYLKSTACWSKRSQGLISSCSRKSPLNLLRFLMIAILVFLQSFGLDLEQWRKN